MIALNKFWIGALGTLGIAAATGVGVLYSGVADVSADTPHSPLVYRLLELARERAIARSSADIAPPTNLGDAERAQRGAGNYAAMCAGCHLEPGVDNTEIRLGLYPTPPDLARPAAASADAARSNARRFWIIKHGIKASGMPAWAKGGMEDAAIWNLVAFLSRLPTLTPEQYHTLVEASDGHAHGGMAEKSPKPNGSGEQAPHDHSGHAH